MKDSRIHQVVRPSRQAVSLIVPLVLCLGGCAVLTRSQMGEAKRFSEAAKNYGQLPGGAIRAFEEVHSARIDWTLASTDFSSEQVSGKSWQRLVDSVKSSAEFRAKADQADQALGILDTYAELLGTLASDTFTTSLESNAKALGKNLNDGIGAYNKAFQRSLSPLGSLVSALVRGVGGIWIRHRQTELLQSSVREGSGLVSTLTSDVAQVMKPFLPAADGGDGWFENDRSDLAADFRVEARDAGKNLSPATISSVRSALRRADEGEALARAATSAAMNYDKAFEALRRSLNEKRTLASAVEEIRALAEEIKAARKLKSELETK